MHLIFYVLVQTVSFKTWQNIIILSAYEWHEHVICDPLSLPCLQSRALLWAGGSRRFTSQMRTELNFGGSSLLQWNTLESASGAPYAERSWRKPQTLNDHTPAGFWDHKGLFFTLCFSLLLFYFFKIWSCLKCWLRISRCNACNHWKWPLFFKALCVLVL